MAICDPCDTTVTDFFGVLGDDAGGSPTTMLMKSPPSSGGTFALSPSIEASPRTVTFKNETCGPRRTRGLQLPTLSRLEKDVCDAPSTPETSNDQSNETNLPLADGEGTLRPGSGGRAALGGIVIRRTAGAVVSTGADTFVFVGITLTFGRQRSAAPPQESSGLRLAVTVV
jgi:hypothetical protein